MVKRMENMLEIEYVLSTEEKLYIGSGFSTSDELGWDAVKVYTKKGGDISANSFYSIPYGANKRKLLVPGSSLKGLFRACAFDLIKKEPDDFFGSNDTASRILFEDLKAEGSIISIAQAAISTGRKKNSVPRHYICLAEGQSLKGKLQLRNCSKEELTLVLSCFREISSGKYPLGGNKSRGMGIISIKPVKIVAYSPRSNIEWLKNAQWAQDGLLKRAEIDTKTLDWSYLISSRTVFDATLEVMRPLHIGDGRGNLVTFNDKYVIPGSSLKGAYRAATNLMTNEIFGSLEESSGVIFSDFYPVTTVSEKDLVPFRLKGPSTNAYKKGAVFKGNIILKKPEDEKILLEIFKNEIPVGRADFQKMKGRIKISLKKL